MRVVYKEKLFNRGEIKQTVKLPTGSVIRHVDVQHGEICIWFECDNQVGQEERTFMLFGTGHAPIPETAEYVGTFLAEGGALVFHVYENTP